MKKIEARFGHESCTCGAYETNMKELERLRKGGATPPNLFMRANETENDDGEYKAPRTRPISRSRANSIQAPTAQIAPFDFDADMSGFDFSLEPQENWDFDGLQAFNNATEDVNAEQQPPQRRSSRNSKKAVHYADDAGEEDDEDGDGDGDAGAIDPNLMDVEQAEVTMQGDLEADDDEDADADLEAVGNLQDEDAEDGEQEEDDAADDE